MEIKNERFALMLSVSETSQQTYGSNYSARLLGFFGRYAPSE